MTATIPADNHADGDPGHDTDHNNIADVLSQHATALAQLSGVVSTDNAVNESAIDDGLTSSRYLDLAGGVLGPADFGLIGWTQNPGQCSSTYQAGNAGRLQLYPFRAALTATVNKIWYAVDVVGTGYTGTFLGLYSVAGTTATLLGQCSTDQSSAMMAGVTAKSAVLDTGVPVTIGSIYYVGLVITTQTTGAKLIGNASLSAGFTNMGIAAGTPGFAMGSATGQTSLPSSITATNILGGNFCFVMTG